MNFLPFTVNPKKTTLKFKKKYSYKEQILTLFLVTFLITITTFLSRFILSYFNLEITQIGFPEKNISYFLMGVILAPVLEEFIFRAPLKFTKRNLWFFCIGYIYLVSRFIYKSNSIYGVIGILSLTLVLIYLYKYRVYKTHFKLNVIIYLSALIFSAIHFQNLDFDYTSTIGALTYAFPIFFGGLVLSYLRLKYSLLAAIIFHSLHNLVAYAFFYFS